MGHVPLILCRPALYIAFPPSANERTCSPVLPCFCDGLNWIIICSLTGENVFGSSFCFFYLFQIFFSFLWKSHTAWFNHLIPHSFSWLLSALLKFFKVHHPPASLWVCSCLCSFLLFFFFFFWDMAARKVKRGVVHPLITLAKQTLVSLWHEQGHGQDGWLWRRNSWAVGLSKITGKLFCWHSQFLWSSQGFCFCSWFWFSLLAFKVGRHRTWFIWDNKVGRVGTWRGQCGGLWKLVTFFSL